MQPRNGFIWVEHAAHTGSAGEPETAAWRVSGADAAAIAFVPSGALDTLPTCGLTTLDDALSAGVVSWLGEGTPPPPASFDGPRDFLATLKKRQHRGALAIVEPIAYLDRNERIIKVTFRLSSGRVGAGFVQRDQGTMFGVGGATDKRRFNVTLGERFARIDCWQRFVMGHAGDLEGRFPGAEVAPLGWLFITYLLYADGTSQAWCASSYLPSAWFYRDYLRMHRRDLDQASDVEAEAVLRPQPDVPTGTRWACLDTSTGCLNAVA